MDAHEIEKKWQKKWGEKGVFEPGIDGKKKKFFMAIPYPYASGPLHIGHGRTYCNADVIFRFHKMLGENALWPMAYHVTGTPVLAISYKIKTGDKKTIDLYKSYVGLYEDDEKKIDEIIESFKEPVNVAKYFAGVISKDFKSLGLAIDWTRQFTTGDPDYNTYIEWQFRQLKEKDYLTTGNYPILYCLNCKNAVGEDDIKSGDEIAPEVAEYTAIKFKCGDSYLVASTFRPETIYGVTNVWVHPDKIYVRAEVDGGKWIISEDAFKKLERQKDCKKLSEFPGSELVDKRAESPIGDSVPILPADFVETDEATGVVYSVPAHAPVDYMALIGLQKEGKYKKIKPVSIIKVPGYGKFPAEEICGKMGIKSQNDRKLEEATEKIYKAEFYNGVLKENCGDFAGEKVNEVKEEVVKYLRKIKGADSFYEVSAKEKPVKCRCGGKVVVAVLPNQWFINYGNPEWKKKATQHLSEMNIYPEIYRKFFEDTFDWVDKRPCARRRGIGTPLPFDKDWMIESLSDSTIYPAFYIFKKIINEEKIKPENLTDSLYTYAVHGKGDPEKISEETSLPVKTVLRFREELEHWYPVDLRHTGIAHISNHLTFYIFNHVGLFPKKFWPKAITLNELLIREGKKMSKSLGNVIPLAEIPEKYSADLYRLYSVYSAELSSTLDFREKDVENVGKKLRKFKALIRKSKDSTPKKNKYLISKFNRAVKESTSALENYHLRDYVQKAFFDMLNSVNTALRKEKDAGIVKVIAEDWLKLLTPLIPHTAEELWHIFNDSFISEASWPEFDESLIDPEAEYEEEFLKKLVKDLRELNELLGEPEKVYIYTPELWKYELFSELKQLHKKNQKEIINELMKTKLKTKKIVPLIISVKKDPSKLPGVVLSGDKEEEILKNNLEFLKEELGIRLLLNPEEDPQSKKKAALPGKPALYFVKS